MGSQWRGRGSTLAAAMSQDVFFQRDCVVMLRIPGAVYQSDTPVPRCVFNGPPSFGVLIQFSEIALAELRPLFRIVRKPSPESIARSRIFEPAVEREIGFFDSPRPEPLHQIANAIL